MCRKFTRFDFAAAPAPPRVGRCGNIGPSADKSFSKFHDSDLSRTITGTTVFWRVKLTVLF